MKILLTFTGFHDPYAVGLVGQEEQPGPILSLVRARAFDQVILFATPGAEKNTQATQEALHSLHPELDVEVRDLSLADPTDYVAILRGLRAHADPLAALPEPYEGFSLEEYLASARKQLILRALETARGNQSEAARLLGITPQAVHKFLRKGYSGFT